MTSHTYNIRGVEVKFPYAAYQCQLIYMEKVIECLQEGKNALLESPTGTGKTLCLLCACLAWREHMARQLRGSQSSLGSDQASLEAEQLLTAATDPRNKLPLVIYASRTHSQLSQVIRELKNTAYRPRTSILGSRAQMCVHPTVQNVKGNAQNVMCRQHVSTHRCSFHETVQEMKKKDELINQISDIEDLVTMGREQTTCPFYLTRELQHKAEMLFMPYNYLVDSMIRQTLKIDLSNAILIFDEAHNLESVCTEAASCEITTDDLRGCLKEIERAVKIVSSSSHDYSAPIVPDTDDIEQSLPGGTSGADHVDASEFIKLKVVIEKLKEMIESMTLPRDGLTENGATIYQLLEKVKITAETKSTVLETISTVTSVLTSSEGTRYSNLHAFSEILRKLFMEGFDAAQTAQYYKLHVQVLNNNNKGFKKATIMNFQETRKLSLWCFSPAVAMNDLRHLGIRNIILTSGTLSPLDAFAYEMQTEFPIRLENPHVIHRGQVWVGVVPEGPSGIALNSKFDNRNSVEYRQSLGHSLVNLARIVQKGGLLVFFPSYDALSSAVDYWKTPIGDNAETIWDRICKSKQIIIEPRESMNLTDAMNDFYEKVRDPELKGAAFFAVCRGKVSEGLDFMDDNGRAVVITGLPFPNQFDAKVRLKKQFLNEMQHNPHALSLGVKPLSGDDWYKQSAFRAVNQAVGRVIRHSRDYGGIILCDERFRGASKYMSSWLRPYFQVFDKFGEALRSLSGFFKEVDGNIVSNHSKSSNSNQLALGGKSAQSSINIHDNIKEINQSRGNVFARLKEQKVRVSYGIIQGPRTDTAQHEREEKSRTSSDNNPHSGGNNNPHSGGNKQLTIHTKKQQSSLEFLALVKELLDRAKYKLFTVVMRKYRAKTVDNQSMCHEVLDIFAGQTVLLEGFERFLPEKQRDYWRDLVSATNKTALGAAEVTERKDSAESTAATAVHSRTEDATVAASNEHTVSDKGAESMLGKPVTLAEERNKELISTREIEPRAGELTSSNSAISPPDRGLKRKVNELLTSDDELPSSSSPKDYPHKKMKLAHENKIIQITDTSSLDHESAEPEHATRPKPALPDVLQISDEIKPAKTPEKREMMSPKSRVIYDLVTGLPTKSAKKPKLQKSGPLSDNTNYESQHSEVISLEDSEGQTRPAMSKSASDISAVRSSKEEPEQSPQCPICLSRLKEPFVSVKCGHMCCYLCWLQWFKTKLECPVCRERTREKNLKKVFFYM